MFAPAAPKEPSSGSVSGSNARAASITHSGSSVTAYAAAAAAANPPPSMADLNTCKQDQGRRMRWGTGAGGRGIINTFARWRLAAKFNEKSKRVAFCQRCFYQQSCCLTGIDRDVNYARTRTTDVLTFCPPPKRPMKARLNTHSIAHTRSSLVTTLPAPSGQRATRFYPTTRSNRHTEIA